MLLENICIPVKDLVSDLGRLTIILYTTVQNVDVIRIDIVIDILDIAFNIYCNHNWKIDFCIISYNWLFTADH